MLGGISTRMEGPIELHCRELRARIEAARKTHDEIQHSLRILRGHLGHQRRHRQRALMAFILSDRNEVIWRAEEYMNKDLTVRCLMQTISHGICMTTNNKSERLDLEMELAWWVGIL